MSMSGAIGKILDPVGLFRKEAAPSAAAPAAPAAPTMADSDAMAEAEMRKQKTGQRAAGAGAMRSASSVDMLGRTSPMGRREASRQLLG